ncbi:unnamed protein product [Heterobilharzia americana]|nr:unnamed protein product [Heterobilharzia americana]
MSSGLCGHSLNLLSQVSQEDLAFHGVCSREVSAVPTTLSALTSPQTTIHLPPSSLSSNLPSRFSLNNPTSSLISSSSAAFDNNLNPQNTIPGLLKPHSELHIGAFSVRTLHQIG